MMRLTITMDEAVEMIAGFVREGVTFDAVERGGMVVITFTGGF